jgi:hypothetical protein
VEQENREKRERPVKETSVCRHSMSSFFKTATAYPEVQVGLGILECGGLTPLCFARLDERAAFSAG